VRSFHAIYNPSLAIRALAAVRRELPEARLVMIGRDTGDGSLAEAQRTARELSVLDAVEFAGPRPKDEIPARLATGDVFINTTRIDNTPVSVLEAMASGLCIVSTSVGGIPYLLEDGRDALLVAPDDPEAMAAAVVRVVRDPRLARGLSEGGRAVALGYDWKVVVPRWNALLESVGGATS